MESITMQPEIELLAAFWRCLRNDLKGRGVTYDSLPYVTRRLPYDERVTIERKQLQVEATVFLLSEDFQWWADQSGLDPVHLRTQLYDAHSI